MLKNDPRDWEAEALLADSQWARSFSPTNIALAKYWGKRDLKLNLPTNNSISACLAYFGTFTTVEFNPKFSLDSLTLDEKKHTDPNGEPLKKVKRVLNELRKLAGRDTFARVQSLNNFPTGAGLASSASGLSALTLAAASALKLDLSLENLSRVARLGSGSATRSFFDGYAEWECGENPDGSDSCAHALKPHTHWPLDATIAVIQENKKEWPSTSGMNVTSETSPFFESWVRAAAVQVPLIRNAVNEKKFMALAEAAESNCLRMHGSAMASSPPIFYWSSKTLQVIETVWQLRKKGAEVFFTIDAGPNVVIFSQGDHDRQEITDALKTYDVEILKTRVGPGARVLDLP